MALQYKVLERFSEEARRRVAERVFARKDNLGSFVCEQGDCVMAALLRADNIEPTSRTPHRWDVAELLGVPEDREHPECQDITRIIELNDSGKLANPAAVRALLLGEAGEEGGGE